jgi:hypothetical protein
MAKISSRQELKDYCLRRLGYPVIEINVDDDQVEDRIEDALEFFHEYHFDGVERFYFTPKLRLSELFLSGILGENFQVGEEITGGTSQAKAKIVRRTPNSLVIKGDNPNAVNFASGETITGSKSGFSASLRNNTHYFIGELAKKYIDVDDPVTGVIRVFPLGSAGSSTTGTNIFNVVYQFRLNDMYNLLSSDITYYNQVKMHLQLLDDMFAGSRTIRFNRKMNRLFIDVNWDEVFSEGDHVAIEAYVIVDPEKFIEVYNDMFLKRYATALIKRQWGTNLKKFQGMQLPGGVQMDGQRMFEEATTEISDIEKEMQLRYELPVDLMVG